ncbi:related to F1F0-ATP synthase subunit E [Cephalotrichum gorgonifer]|uniref:ATP synthase F(0) complex subunit e, mitochondrial n=1 Tax=Cephalotrichum gorgonifer TaxID=2041049 RepID=A0AAE8MPU7_9PEZI|nr:related to F1F0-ATP synthase subunit E [Cephalotrichum gorgonifer]
MSGSAGVNVLRYTALGLGVLYGFTHQRKITAAQNAAAAQHEYEHKQSLINQAKSEYAKIHNPAPVKADTVIRDPMDPKFDFEAFFTNLAKENP